MKYVLTLRGFVMGVYEDEKTAREDAQMRHNNDNARPNDFKLFRSLVVRPGGNMGCDFAECLTINVRQ